MKNERDGLNAFVVGVGVAGERHVAARNRLGEKNISIYDNNVARVDEIAAKFGVRPIKTEDQLAEAYKNADMVHICTPDHLHKEATLLALKNGAHAFVEKPLATNLADAKEMQEESKKQKKELIIGTGYRLTPSFAEVRKRVNSGEVGAITHIETTYLHDMRDPIKATPWRLSQDFLYGGGIHAVDLAHWVAGEDFTEVSATTGDKQMGDYQSQEVYDINFKTASGKTIHVKLNAREHGDVHGTDLVVTGEKGRLESHNKKNDIKFYKNGSAEPEVIQVKNDGVFTVDEAIKILDQWITGKRADYSPLPGIDEGMKVMEYMNAIEKAIQSGKAEKISN